MSAFYGSVQGNRGVATKGGSAQSGIAASVQSYDGSITTRLFYNKQEELCVKVEFSADCSADMNSWDNETIFTGTVKEYIDKLAK